MIGQTAQAMAGLLEGREGGDIDALRVQLLSGEPALQVDAIKKVQGVVGPTQFVGGLQKGINSETGRAELFSRTSRGEVKSTGVEAPPSAPLVSIDSKAETAESVERSKLLVKQLGTIEETAQGAAQTLQQLELLDAIPAETNPLAGFKSMATQLASVVPGFDISAEQIGRVASVEQARSVINKLVLTQMQAQKGPQTENDAKRIESALASISNLPEVNLQIIRVQKAIEIRKIAQAEFWREHEEAEGTLKGAASAWNRYKIDTPMVRTLSDGSLQFVNEAVAGAMQRGLSREEALTAWRLLDAR
ncbi:MAG: hypothetical protein HKN64_05160, partial [Woeseiaceae bacterium]|nr:hypothetical protein [Woeseiaceae bacterium]